MGHTVVHVAVGDLAVLNVSDAVHVECYVALHRFQAVAVVVLLAALVADQNDDNDCHHQKCHDES